MTEAAEADLEQRITSLAERSPGAALRLNGRFNKALFRLRDYPLSCGLAHESHAFPEQLWHLLFGASSKRKYRALFVVRDNEVIILAIRAPGENDVSPGDIDT